MKKANRGATIQVANITPDQLEEMHLLTGCSGATGGDLDFYLAADGTYYIRQRYVQHGRRFDQIKRVSAARAVEVWLRNAAPTNWVKDLLAGACQHFGRAFAKN